jgi:hypothetical protein
MKLPRLKRILQQGCSPDHGVAGEHSLLILSDITT